MDNFLQDKKFRDIAYSGFSPIGSLFSRWCSRVRGTTVNQQTDTVLVLNWTLNKIIFLSGFEIRRAFGKERLDLGEDRLEEGDLNIDLISQRKEFMV